MWEKSEAPPYLKATRCKFCKNGPHYNWEDKISSEKLLVALIRNHVPVVPPIRRIAVASKKSGRTKALLIYHDQGEYKLSANKFRMMMGANVIRST